MLIDNGLEILDDAQCWALLRTQSVGRVGVSIGALPVILPVNFSAMDGTIVFATAPGTTLAAAVAGSVVAFEVDDSDPVDHSGWSVLLVGEAHEVEADSELVARLSAAGGAPWAAGERPAIVRVTPGFLSGRRLVGH
jgi:nitroimidazol reductase NimA-like FMN-containing flavoprotein (pyridoxamine 5'-phosphate oxidase superfamily)